VPRKATSQDVADLAGVSRSAVSLVLNGRGAGNIAPDKQALIMEAARSLGYTPNAVALSLRSRRSSTIGVVTDATATTAFGGLLLRGASDVALAAGHLLLVIDTRNDPQREARAYETLQNRQVDGFLFAAMSLRPYDVPPALRGASSALANCYAPDDSLPAYLPDEVAGSRSVTRHLIERGHRDIVMFTGTSDLVASGLREQGFREAMDAARAAGGGSGHCRLGDRQRVRGCDARADAVAAAHRDRLRQRPRRCRCDARGGTAGTVRAG
jgi:LacI family transcriptional regulator